MSENKKKKSLIPTILKLAAIGAGAAAVYCIIKKKKEKDEQTVVVADVEHNKIVVNGKEYPLDSEQDKNVQTFNLDDKNLSENANDGEKDVSISSDSEDTEVFNELDKIKENINEFDSKLPD